MKKTKKLQSKKISKKFEPLKPDLWSPLIKEEKKRLKTLKPLIKELAIVLYTEEEMKPLKLKPEVEIYYDPFSNILRLVTKSRPYENMLVMSLNYDKKFKESIFHNRTIKAKFLSHYFEKVGEL